MALPRSSETERGLYLRGIVEATNPEELLRWPHPTDDDLTFFGRLIVLYSNLDFVLRFIAEIMDNNGMLSSPWAGKTHGLTIAKTSEAIQSSQIWTVQNRFGFMRIDELRRMRNLVAHFVPRRFPSEEAYIFMTKSAIDYRQVYGELPGANRMLYGITDVAQLQGILPEVQALLTWVSNLPGDLSRPIRAARPLC